MRDGEFEFDGKNAAGEQHFNYGNKSALRKKGNFSNHGGVRMCIDSPLISPRKMGAFRKFKVSRGYEEDDWFKKKGS